MLIGYLTLIIYFGVDLDPKATVRSSRSRLALLLVVMVVVVLRLPCIERRPRRMPSSPLVTPPVPCRLSSRRTITTIPSWPHLINFSACACAAVSLCAGVLRLRMAGRHSSLHHNLLRGVVGMEDAADIPE